MTATTHDLTIHIHELRNERVRAITARTDTRALDHELARLEQQLRTRNTTGLTLTM